jgi:choline dehydrogenase-like flavoprotein
MGTTIMGNDPGNSVADAWGRAHDHPNLFIVGSSLFPSGGTVNPTLTIAALSLRTADAISREFGGIVR